MHRRTFSFMTIKNIADSIKFVRVEQTAMLCAMQLKTPQSGYMVLYLGKCSSRIVHSDLLSCSSSYHTIFSRAYLPWITYYGTHSKLWIDRYRLSQ